ncbi:MAG: Asp-tRNA(Asn)/Glu-tRNA(Gln) amidotransferase subunit GatB [Candidatus Aenigmarchaeota archaeon]|nr:Asp-tRNA(Asn)/Glu-tRNA(Gln) amidotransferase subunit GatB [Candidatus Aenigmarchaeota archaeon]
MDKKSNKITIGLECHVQLKTDSKLFCSCPNKFTQQPNTAVCDICLGMPGSKPMLNRKAVEYAVKIGIALNCRMNKEMSFSRKAYFYPDMSKNFQITQYEMPLCHDGFLEIDSQKIRITRIQIEEDPARLVHQGAIESSKYVLVDYNRSGAPLCEIVTEPDFSDAQHARKFLQELSLMLEYLGVYDPNIEGSMRVDTNISLSKGARVEIKNISGFKEVEKALCYEMLRQSSLVKRGISVKRETRGWNAESGITISLRSKEQEEDYGYIYETDLPIASLAEKTVELRYTIPEFAKQKIQRYQTELRIGKEMAISIASEPDIAKAFEVAVKETDAHKAAIFFSKMLKKVLNYENKRLSETGIKTEWLLKIINRIEKKEITERAAELLLRDMVIKPQDPDILLGIRGLTRIDKKEALEPIVMDMLTKNSLAVMDYKQGRLESLEFLVGQVMRKTGGRADPITTRNILKEKLDD